MSDFTVRPGRPELRELRGERRAHQGSAPRRRRRLCPSREDGWRASSTPTTFRCAASSYCLQAYGLESLEQVDYVYTDYARLPRWLNSGPGYRKLEHDYLKLRLRYPRERIRIVDHHDGARRQRVLSVAVRRGRSARCRRAGLPPEHAEPVPLPGRRAKALERGDHWGIGRLYSLVTGSVLPYGPEEGFGKTMGLAPYGAEHPGPVLEFNGAR